MPRPTASQLCDDIRASASLGELADLWSRAPQRLKDEGEVRAAYDYRKACLSDETHKYLRGG